MTTLFPVDLTSSHTHYSLRQQADQLRSSLMPDLRRRSPALSLPPPSAFTRAILSSNLTLEGETYVIRYQAKARGYTWRSGSWHRQISTPLFNLDSAALTQGLARLSELIAAEQGIFKRGFSLDQPLLALPVGAR